MTLPLMYRWLLLMSFTLRSCFAVAVQLPSMEASTHAAATVEAAGNWWAQVDDRIYHAPPVSLLGLSTEISNYYYAIGSYSALNDELKKHRVGGQGRWHIFHLPEGPSAVPAPPTSGDRRASISSLIQLHHGEVLRNTFPVYVSKNDYKDPLSPAAREIESAVAKLVTGDKVQMNLENLLRASTTRSWESAESKKAQEFLRKEFESAGFTTCLHDFDYSGKTLTNVVAVLPGSSQASVTLGAHYDSRPFTGLAPGAEDNGSGVAALLAIAKAIGQTKVDPEKTLYFVAFDGEEPGLLGSAAFVASLTRNTLPNKCQVPASTQSFLQVGRSANHEAIIMDEVGWLSPKLAKNTVNLESYDTSGPLMDHLAHSSSIHNGPSLEVVHSSNPFGSDHMSFLQNGLSAVLTINGDDEAYPFYHQSSDRITSVNTSYVAKIALMNMGGALRAAGVRTDTPSSDGSS